MEDVVVAGAGAAGLACARELLAHGARVTLIEARERVGGRVHSVPFPGTSEHAELGAEFVHGAQPELLSLLEAAGNPFVDITDEHLFLQRGRLRKVAFWGRVDAAIRRARRLRRDVPVEKFLGTLSAGAETKALFRAFVDGFHAADLGVLGAKELACAAEDDDATLNGRGLFRPHGRYDEVLRGLVTPGLEACLRLRTVLKEVRREGAHLELTLRDDAAGGVRRLLTRFLVVTLPIGVLRAPADSPGGVRWHAEPARLAELRKHLHMGAVSRLTFRFRSRFWEDLSKEAPVSFLHAGPEFFYPTWWTRAPLRWPGLVAWQGGPKARELSALGAPARVALALQTLSRLARRSEDALRRELLDWREHDWTADPYTLGAYSYVGTGGGAFARRLGREAGHGILFAGEASADGAARGTVHGAIRSGVAAAKSLLLLEGGAFKAAGASAA